MAWVMHTSRLLSGQGKGHFIWGELAVSNVALMKGPCVIVV